MLPRNAFLFYLILFYIFGRFFDFSPNYIYQFCILHTFHYYSYITSSISLTVFRTVCQPSISTLNILHLSPNCFLYLHIRKFLCSSKLLFLLFPFQVWRFLCCHSIQNCLCCLLLRQPIFSSIAIFLNRLSFFVYFFRTNYKGLFIYFCFQFLYSSHMFVSFSHYLSNASLP